MRVSYFYFFLFFLKRVADVYHMTSLLGIQEWGVFGMQRRRLSKYLTQIYEDDMHLIAERKGAKLPPSGITVALWERGL
jgi:hypothetical protein